MSEPKSPVKRLLADGEEKFQDMVNELVSNPRFAEALGKALKSGARTKGKIDRNLQTALHLAHVPTKADYEDLVHKVTGLGHEVAKLEKRLDKILVRLEALADAANKR